MLHLTQIKRRMRSVNTTQKLTHAMRLISMSLYSKLDKQRNAIEHHKSTLQEVFSEVFTQCDGYTNPILLPEDILNSSPLFIIVSATKGFCGGLNTNLFRYLEHKLFVEEHQTPTFITIGQKATTFIENKKLGSILEKHHSLNSNNFADIAKHVAQTISKQSPSFSSVTMFSTQLKNFFAQVPQKNKIIPLKQTSAKPQSLKSLKQAGAVYAQKTITPETDIIWEQDQHEIVDFLAARYLNNTLTNNLLQALFSEYASRFVAMDSATNNAEKYLDNLTLQFNKLRQAMITREVCELSASL